MAYQDAIENNFSHEQMTPLNPIISNISINKQRLIGLYKEVLGINEGPSSQIERVSVNLLQQILQRRPESMQALQQSISIEQSTKGIWYYNTNQIQRMKIIKNQMEINPYPNKDMIATIWNVIWPFEHFIFKRKVNFYLIQEFKFPKNTHMVSDWKQYESALFNVI
jgi:hypothetical protein